MENQSNNLIAEQQATELAKRCDPENKDLEKQADIYFGFLQGYKAGGVDFAKWVFENWSQHKGKYLHRGDFEKSGKPVTIEQLAQEYLKTKL